MARKTWTGDTEADRPDSIEVQLLQDGVAYGSPITVTKADDWKYEFKKCSRNKCRWK